MLQDAKNLSLGFLPYSLSISLLLSAVVSLIYSRSIKNNIDEIKSVTDQMIQLDKNACLVHTSDDEVGELKEQINELYFTLLKSIDDIELKNKEIIELEKLKYDFLKGASHELKTPLASLKIILENMIYNVGKYKNRDVYLEQCVDIVDGLSSNISQILSIYSIDHLKNDEEDVIIQEVLKEVLDKYELLAQQKNILVNNKIGSEHIYIGRNAFNVILSNLISNAVKYTNNCGLIDIGMDEDCFYIKNSYIESQVELNKDTSHGLGLYIVCNLLNNYQIDYEIIQNQNTYLFKIYKKDSQL